MTGKRGETGDGLAQALCSVRLSKAFFTMASRDSVKFVPPGMQLRRVGT